MSSRTLRGARVLDAGGAFTGPRDLAVRDGLVDALAPVLPHARWTQRQFVVPVVFRDLGYPTGASELGRDRRRVRGQGRGSA